MAWTDERLDDLARRMDAGFERVDRDIRDLRGEIGGLRHEMGGLRRDIDGVRMMLVRLTGGMVIGLVGVIAAVALNGAGA